MEVPHAGGWYHGHTWRAGAGLLPFQKALSHVPFAFANVDLVDILMVGA